MCHIRAHSRPRHTFTHKVSSVLSILKDDCCYVLRGPYPPRPSSQYCWRGFHLTSTSGRCPRESAFHCSSAVVGRRGCEAQFLGETERSSPSGDRPVTVLCRYVCQRMGLRPLSDCILNSGLAQKREPVSPDEVLQALHYFNIPETLWPEGLIAASAVSHRYDIEACTIMDTIKSKVMAMAKKDQVDSDRTQQYYIYRNSPQGPSKDGNIFDLRTEYDGPLWSKLVLQLPQPLKERIQALADKAFLQLEFNPKPTLTSHYSYLDGGLSWSFSIKVHSLSTEKGVNSLLKVTPSHQ
jgi:hypothetical protein